MDNYKNKIINLPLVPLRGISVFPNMLLHFDAGRPKTVRALEIAAQSKNDIFIVTQKDSILEEPKEKDLFEYGTISNIKQVVRLPQGGVRVLVSGEKRAKIKKLNENYDYLEAEIEEYEYIKEDEISDELKAMVRMVKDDVGVYINLNPKIQDKSIIRLNEEEDPEVISNIAASSIMLSEYEYQKILAELDLEKRFILIHSYFLREIELLKIEEKISVRVRNQMNKIQKDYYLREQIKAIQKELGEDQEIEAEIEDLRVKIDKKVLPEEVRERAFKELKRLSMNTHNPAEAGVIRNYLDLILELPWEESKSNEFNLNYAEEILNNEHYGLKEVKERIIEYIAVKKLNPESKGNILLLVGPPGVGKTSIARSIAHALDRDFVRLSLGGVRDEAEIRGHRRTYIGAMPGKIISGIKKAGTKNPVFLLDEIDKINSDFRGDPASALLEVLDPEQNKDFEDHFLDLPFDLSQVLFITTANSLNIPPALMDRMEVIRIPGYTEEEKFYIATKFLSKKQRVNNGLSYDEFNITDGAVKKIIRNYTREAGVRELERMIAKVIRKSVVKIVSGEKSKVNVKISDLEELLGPERYTHDSLGRKNQIGVTNGLAWTSVGGTTLQVEAIANAGSGKVTLTGQLGNVMKESAMAAVTYIRSNAKKLNLDPEFYKKIDFHIHVPEGAVPKDGPSAGVTMATSLYSALSKKPVDRYVAMTGEITLTGRVLPIGGLKEKILAALRMGIKKVIIPFDNQKDMDEIPDIAKEKMEFFFVKDVMEVFEIAVK